MTSVKNVWDRQLFVRVMEGEPRQTHLELVRGKGRVGRGEAQNVGDAGGSQGLDALVLVGEKVPLTESGSHIVEGGRVDLVLVEALEFLCQPLQTVEQSGDGDGLAGTPCKLFVELQTDGIVA